MHFSLKEQLHNTVKSFLDVSKACERKRDTVVWIIYLDQQPRAKYPYTRLCMPSTSEELDHPGCTDQNTQIMELSFDKLVTHGAGGRLVPSVRLPHPVLLKKLGKEIKHLVFDAFDTDYDEDDLEGTAFDDTVRPTLMEEILTNCPNLETLDIRHVDFYELCTRKMVHKSIHTLQVHYGDFFLDGFYHIKNCLPNLGNFTVKHCELINTRVIHLSNNILENFTWSKPEEPMMGCGSLQD